MLSKMMKKNDKGFTLIELMIVIAIIGILAAIAVPQFLTYRTRSYNSAAKAIVHNLKADNGNLNAELGVYGHTEVAAATLVAVDGGANIANTLAATALRMSATATQAGARLVGTNNASTRTIAIGTSLGNMMIAVADDANNTNDDSTYHAFARHFKGDTAYAIDADVENALLSVTNGGWPNNSTIACTTIAAVLPIADDVRGVAGGGLPTANWTLAP